MSKWKLNSKMPERPVPGTVVVCRDASNLRETSARYFRDVGWMHEGEHRPMVGAGWPKDGWPVPGCMCWPEYLAVEGVPLFVRDDGWMEVGYVEPGLTVITRDNVKAVVLLHAAGYTLVSLLGFGADAWNSKLQVMIAK